MQQRGVCHLPTLPTRRQRARATRRSASHPWSSASPGGIFISLGAFQDCEFTGRRIPIGESTPDNFFRFAMRPPIRVPRILKTIKFDCRRSSPSRRAPFRPPGGRDRVDHPNRTGHHDDASNAVVGALWRATAGAPPMGICEMFATRRSPSRSVRSRPPRRTRPTSCCSRRRSGARSFYHRPRAPWLGLSDRRRTAVGGRRGRRVVGKDRAAVAITQEP